MNLVLVFLFAILFYFLLIRKMGKTYPILYMFLLTYFLQYIFSPYLIYNNYEDLTRQMPIDQEQYFDYTLPAFLFLFAGVFAFNKDVDISGYFRKIDPVAATQLGYLLLGISFFFDLGLVSIFNISSIGSFTRYLKFVGAFCLLFSHLRVNYVLIGVVFLSLALEGLRAAVFIDFFAWCTYLFFFISHKFRLSFWMRAGFIVVAAPALIIIQSVKDEYRHVTWVKEKEGGIDLYARLIEKEDEENAREPFSETDGVVNTVARLSQGWHLGLTLKHVPKRQPFADGADMIEDIKASFLPRVFFQDKKVVGSQGKFYRFTGRRLHGNTSMTIGVLGDFYVNFGFVGSWIMLFVFGALLAKGLHYFIKRYVVNDPINIVWVPFILSYLIRANNDFYIIVNNIIKGIIIFLFITWLRKVLFVPRRKLTTA